MTSALTGGKWVAFGSFRGVRPAASLKHGEPYLEGTRPIPLTGFRGVRPAASLKHRVGLALERHHPRPLPRGTPRGLIEA